MKIWRPGETRLRRQEKDYLKSYSRRHLNCRRSSPDDPAPPNQAGPGSSSSPFRGKGKGKGKSVVKGPFMGDFILLTGTDVNTVPRQAKRVRLMENGFAISGFQLQKEWSE